MKTPTKNNQNSKTALKIAGLLCIGYALFAPNLALSEKQLRGGACFTCEAQQGQMSCVKSTASTVGAECNGVTGNPGCADGCPGGAGEACKQIANSANNSCKNIEVACEKGVNMTCKQTSPPNVNPTTWACDKDGETNCGNRGGCKLK